MKKIIFIAIFAFSVQSIVAQNPNPFKSIGKPAPEFLSLSNGKYPEIFENDTLRKIGSVMFNTRTNKIEYFIETDTLYSEATLQPEIVSRWLSQDPLARKYPSMSPYVFTNNNPILLIDPDGKEPIWGQLGSLKQIMGEMDKALNDKMIRGTSIDLQYMINHFEANRKYTREDGKLVDVDATKNVKRYLYTEKSGWLDMEHFFEMALYTKENGVAAASLYSYASEEAQNTTISAFGTEYWNRKASGYSYEDIPSDFAGIDFWLKYGKQIEGGDISLIDATQKYLESLSPTEPSDAPNIDYIPHFVEKDGPNTLRNMGNGLTGDKLKTAHKKEYDKRSPEMKKKMSEARTQITD
ncbi:MAG: hypothetical protein KF732_11280 [Flavobacteriales bacterium]|jgi:RHS repeat-associated protein|nr:hypothetical protein [Flavobacteriales bacterium]MBX2960524.1 hypothetical protein [Flavobacteriales bacterium]MCL4856203.1 hypothetical protein [Flavobacteriales bacterium]